MATVLAHCHPALRENGYCAIQNALLSVKRNADRAPTLFQPCSNNDPTL